MIKNIKHLLAALCCVGLIVSVPSCKRDKNKAHGKVVKETKYKKETTVKREKKPKKMKNNYQEDMAQ